MNQDKSNLFSIFYNKRNLIVCLIFGLLMAFLFDKGFKRFPLAIADSSVVLSIGSAAQASPGSSVDLDIFIDPSGAPRGPSTVAWELDYNSSDIASIVWKTDGSAATSAGKAGVCNTPSSGVTRCLVGALFNNNSITKGILGTITVTISNSVSATSIPLRFSNLSASDPSANPIAITGVDGVITVNQPQNNILPTISVILPIAGATVSGTSTTVSATAAAISGNITNVKFYLDNNTLLGTANAAPYSITWNTTAYANGSHTLTAQTTDSQNRSAVSAGVPITINNNSSGNALTCQPLTSTAINTGGSVSFSASGGQSPYTLSAPGASGVSGMTATYNNPGSNFQVIVRDAAGHQANCGTVTVTAYQQQPPPSGQQQQSFGCRAMSPVNINKGQMASFYAFNGQMPYSFSAPGSVSSNPSSNMVSGVYNNAGTYRVTASDAAGHQADCGSVTVVTPAPQSPVCQTLTFNPSASRIFSTNFVSTANQKVSIACDYGAKVDSISPSGLSGCSFSGFTGTAANFSCNVPVAPGSYPVSCALSAATVANTCAQNNPLGAIIVTNPEPINFTATATQAAGISEVASCLDGSEATATATVTASATATSNVSQQDAQNKAQAQALANAQAQARANARTQAAAKCPAPAQLTCQLISSANIKTGQQASFSVSGGQSPYTLSAPGASDINFMAVRYYNLGIYQVMAYDAAGHQANCGTVTVTAATPTSIPTPTPIPIPTPFPNPVFVSPLFNYPFSAGNGSLNSFNTNINNNIQSNSGDSSGNQNNNTIINGNNNTITHSNSNCVNNSCNAVNSNTSFSNNDLLPNFFHTSWPFPWPW